MRSAVLIYNPKSGKQVAARLLPALAEELAVGGFEVEPWPTQAPQDATRLAREAVEQGDVEVVFAMGGDGTLRECAAGLLGSEVALGPLPAGTANVLARALDIPRSPLRAARALAVGKAVAFDVGRFGADPFLMMVSAGLDAAIMAKQDTPLKKHIGRAAIGLIGLREWWTYDYPAFELRLDGRAKEVGFFALCNIAQYGGAFRMAPNADFQDGWLDLVLFQGRTRAATAGFALDLALGRHLKRRDVEHHRVREVEILGPLSHGLQVDGDVLDAHLPLKLGIAEHRLKILTPAQR